MINDLKAWSRPTGLEWQQLSILKIIASGVSQFVRMGQLFLPIFDLTKRIPTIFAVS
jgi:hypothetical protein